MSVRVVIYDGECEFCLKCVQWVQQKLEIKAVAFQSTDLSAYQLTIKECAAAVHVVDAKKTYRGAAAVAYLLRLRGNTLSSRLIGISGNLGDWGYHWVATHRSSFLVKIIGWFL